MDAFLLGHGVYRGVDNGIEIGIQIISRVFFFLSKFVCKFTLRTKVLEICHHGHEALRSLLDFWDTRVYRLLKAT